MELSDGPQSRCPRFTDCSIARGKGKIACPSRGDNDAVRWVAVERFGEFVQSKNDRDIQWEKLHDRRRGGLNKPRVKRNLELQPAAHMKHLRFP